MKRLSYIFVSAGAVIAAACTTSEPAQPAFSADLPARSDVAASEIAALNNIASILIDAEAFYRDAAQIPDNEPRIRRSLNALADQRERELDRIRARVTVLGGEADQFGGPLYTGHRVYTGVRTVFSDDGRVAIEEVLRTERELMRRVSSRLKRAETPETKRLLRTIRAQVEADIRSLEQLKSDVA